MSIDSVLSMESGAFTERQLNSAQLEAVTAPAESALMVLAGPGSGKTLTLVHRIGRLLQIGVSMHSILALTFTRKAAEEMQLRLKTYFKASGCVVSTFHSFALGLLRKHPEAAGLRPYFSVVGKARQVQVVSQCMSELKVHNVKPSQDPEDLENYYELIGGAVDISDKYPGKQDDVQVKAVLSWIFSIKSHNENALDTAAPSMQALYIAYQDKLKEANTIDMNDILLLAARLLKDHADILREVQETYQHVLCDEFQDTNEQQLEFLHRIKPNGALTVVGDDDQAIYSWRGASDRAFKQFELMYPSCVRVVLGQNYRSTSSIVELASSLIVHNTSRFVKATITENPAGPPVHLVYCRNPRDEASSIVSLLLKYKEEMDLDWKDCAVLYRVRSVCKEIKKQLEDKGVPSDEYGRDDLIDATVRVVLNYMRLALDLNDDEAFLAIYSKAGRALSRQVLGRLQEVAKQRQSSLFVACKAMSLQGSDRVTDALSDLMLGVGHVHTCSARYTTPALIELILKRGKLKKTRKIEELILRAQGLEGLSGVTSLMKDLAFNTSYINVSTIHQSKGLEWPLVFIACFNERVMPLPPVNAAMLEEERRLAYVAMTRAKQRLILTTVECDSWGEIQLPSRFLIELNSSLLVPSTSSPKRKHSPNLINPKRVLAR